MSDSGTDAGGVRSVQLALDVLEAVAFASDELGVTQIASRLGVAKGSVFRHLSTLVDRGYLNQNSLTARGALVIFAVASASPIEIGVRPGSELSFHASGQGKVLLAFSPRPFQERVLARELQK